MFLRTALCASILCLDPCDNVKMVRALLEERWLPKSVLCLRDYNRHKFLLNLTAGITVGLAALPLAMAFAIAWGFTPQAGFSAAGYLCSQTSFLQFDSHDRPCQGCMSLDMPRSQTGECLLISTRVSNFCAVASARETRHNSLAFCKRLIARSRFSSLGIVRLGRITISLKV